MVSSPPKRIKEIKDYQKIAAGEVIERPASVVKELLENSIDAGATKITIIIKNSGKSLIQVIDDGCGIHPNDVKIAFLPHTSNKIQSAADLNRLDSLGFRGEALYSISSISKVDLISKTSSDPHGIKIEIEGGMVKNCTQTAAVSGTSIKVRDIFYNTPVRYKFLKSDRVEMGHITDIISRYVLAYPQINFKLMNDTTPVLTSPSSPDHLNAIFDIYGKNTAKNCVIFTRTNALFTIEGYVGDPKLAQSTSHNSSVFINQRYVISPTVHESMKKGYKDYIMIHKHPFYVVFLTIDPAKVDFNIHPTKKVVRFEKEERVLSTLIEIMQEVVTKTFGQTTSTGQLTQSITSSSKPIEEYVQKTQASSSVNSPQPVKKSKSSPKIPPSTQQKKKKEPSPKISEKNKRAEESTSKSVPLEVFAPNLLPHKPQFSSMNDWIQTNNFPKMRLISQSGQLNKVYFVFEGEEGFYILDMHAADERINFEKEKKAFVQGGMKKQRLIVPFTIDVPINVKDFLLETLPEFTKFGFDVEHLGGTTFTLRAVPSILRSVTDPQILTDICLEILQIGRESSFTQSIDTIIKYIACHKSIRGGDVIYDPDLPKQLLIKLSQCENPHHCAHGRPTMLYFSWNFLEKEFHR